MLKRIDGLMWLLVLVLLARLLAMAGLPLADTSEPRYAEIARVMAQSGDWITPWFEPGRPFWGKPPLAFWSQALAFRALGVSEFAVRFPSWLATLGTLWLLYQLALNWFDRTVARGSVLILGSMALTFVTAGAVLMDPFLTLGITWSMVAVALVADNPRWYWRYGFFLGLVIGLLAKGPLAVVLMVGQLLPWCLLSPQGRAGVRALPWISGGLLLLGLTLPWYVAAELKTPGFLRYFLLGEHILRFIDPGWAGDLYGGAHERAHGTIWAYWLLAASPWSLLGIALLASRLWRGTVVIRPSQLLRDHRFLFLAGWSLFTPLFFTLAGNILWTYVLPAQPAMALLLAQLIWRRPLQQEAPSTAAPKMLAAGLQLWPAMLMPLGLCAMLVMAGMNPNLLKSEKALVTFVRQQDAAASLVYAERRPFSARYYSRGEAGLVELEQVPALRAVESHPMFLAVPKSRRAQLQSLLGQSLQPVFENKGYLLLEIPAAKPVAAGGDEKQPLTPGPG